MHRWAIADNTITCCYEYAYETKGGICRMSGPSLGEIANDHHHQHYTAVCVLPSNATH